MGTAEILAGGSFHRAVRNLGLSSAWCTFCYHPAEDSYREDYQVWELSDKDFNSLSALDDDSWKKDWGWWRYATGSNLGSVNHEYVIHGERILAWDGNEREQEKNECSQCSDYYKNCVNGKILRNPCYATDDDITQCFGAREYSDIISYLCEEIGVSTEKNVCACAIDLAQQNSMSLSALFKKYLG